LSAARLFNAHGLLLVGFGNPFVGVSDLQQQSLSDAVEHLLRMCAGLFGALTPVLGAFYWHIVVHSGISSPRTHLRLFGVRLGPPLVAFFLSRLPKKLQNVMAITDVVAVLRQFCTQPKKGHCHDTRNSRLGPRRRHGADNGLCVWSSPIAFDLSRWPRVFRT